MDPKIKSFYELSPSKRVSLTEKAIAQKCTLLERWNSLRDSEAIGWDSRSRIAAELLKHSPSVSDFGCGTMNLKKHLSKNQRYVPIDVVARDENTIVCDLNREPIPPTGTEAAAFLGFLEYIHKPEALLHDAAEKFHTLVISYCVTDAPSPPANRREHAWVNDFSSAEMEAIFKKAGLKIISVDSLDDAQKIWHLVCA